MLKKIKNFRKLKKRNFTKITKNYKNNFNEYVFTKEIGEEKYKVESKDAFLDYYLNTYNKPNPDPPIVRVELLKDSITLKDRLSDDILLETTWIKKTNKIKDLIKFFTNFIHLNSQTRYLRKLMNKDINCFKKEDNLEDYLNNQNLYTEIWTEKKFKFILTEVHKIHYSNFLHIYNYLKIVLFVYNQKNKKNYPEVFGWFDKSIIDDRFLKTYLSLIIKKISVSQLLNSKHNYIYAIKVINLCLDEFEFASFIIKRKSFYKCLQLLAVNLKQVDDKEFLKSFLPKEKNFDYILDILIFLKNFNEYDKNFISDRFFENFFLFIEEEFDPNYLGFDDISTFFTNLAQFKDKIFFNQNMIEVLTKFSQAHNFRLFYYKKKPKELLYFFELMNHIKLHTFDIDVDNFKFSYLVKIFLEKKNSPVHNLAGIKILELFLKSNKCFIKKNLINHFLKSFLENSENFEINNESIKYILDCFEIFIRYSEKFTKINLMIKLFDLIKDKENIINNKTILHFIKFNMVLESLLKKKYFFMNNKLNLIKYNKNERLEINEFQKNLKDYFLNCIDVYFKNLKNIQDLKNLLDLMIIFENVIYLEFTSNIFYKILQSLTDCINILYNAKKINLSLLKSYLKFIDIGRKNNFHFNRDKSYYNNLIEYIDIIMKMNNESISLEEKIFIFNYIPKIFKLDSLTDYIKNFFTREIIPYYINNKLTSFKDKEFENFENIFINIKYFKYNLEENEKNNLFLKMSKVSKKIEGEDLLKTLQILCKFKGSEKLINSILENLLTCLDIQLDFENQDEYLDIYINPNYNKYFKIILNNLSFANIKCDNKNSKIALSLIFINNFQIYKNFENFLTLFEIIGFKYEIYLNFLYKKLIFLKNDNKYLSFIKILAIEDLIKIPLILHTNKSIQNLISYYPFNNNNNDLETKKLMINIYKYYVTNKIFNYDFFYKFFSEIENYLIIDQNLFNDLCMSDFNILKFPFLLEFIQKYNNKIDLKFKIIFLFKFFIQYNNFDDKEKVFYHSFFEYFNKLAHEEIVIKDFFKFNTSNSDNNLVNEKNSFTDLFSILETKKNFFHTKGDIDNIGKKNDKLINFNIFEFSNSFQGKKDINMSLVRFYFWEKFKDILIEKFNLLETKNNSEKKRLLIESKKFTNDKLLKSFFNNSDYGKKEKDVPFFTFKIKKNYIFITNYNDFEHIFEKEELLSQFNTYLIYIQTLLKKNNDEQKIKFWDFNTIENENEVKLIIKKKKKKKKKEKKKKIN